MNAIVFDMDGILFDTEKVYMDSFTAVADKRGIPGMDVFFPKCIGCNVEGTRALMREYYGEDFPYDDFRRETSEWFHAYLKQNGLPMKKGAREILCFLKSQNCRIALASSTAYQSVISHLEQSGLREYFCTIVTGDMVKHAKPAPDIYLKACEELGAEPSETFAIEDSPNGIRAAHRAGLEPVMVPDLIPADEEMRRLAFRIFDDLTQVQAWLCSLCGPTHSSTP